MSDQICAGCGAPLGQVHSSHLLTCDTTGCAGNIRLALENRARLDAHRLEKQAVRRGCAWCSERAVGWTAPGATGVIIAACQDHLDRDAALNTAVTESRAHLDRLIDEVRIDAINASNGRLSDPEVEELANLLVQKVTNTLGLDLADAVRTAVADAILVERGLLTLDDYRVGG